MACRLWELGELDWALDRAAGVKSVTVEWQPTEQRWLPALLSGRTTT
jgi:hypothetical protein